MSDRGSGDLGPFGQQRILLACVTVLGCLSLLWVLARPTTSTEQSLSTAPGYREAKTTLDTSPFSPAVGKSTGETTIPGDFDTLPLAAPSTTTTPPPTTTTRPPVGVDPNDKACLAVKILVEGVDGKASMTGSPQVLAEAFRTVMVEAAKTLRQDPAGRYEAAAAEFDVAIFKLHDVQTEDAMRDAIAPFVTDLTELESTGATAAVIDHVRQACPSFLP